MNTNPVRASIFLVTATLFALPLLYLGSFNFFGTFRYFVFGTVSLVLLFLTAQMWLRSPEIPKAFFRSWFAYGMIGYIAVMIIAGISSIDPALSFFSSFLRTNGIFAQIFVLFFALNIYTLIKIKGREIIYKFLKSSVIGAVILSVLIALFSTIGLFPIKFDPLNNAGGMIGNSSLAGAYVLWNVFFCAILIGGKQKKWWIASLILLLISPLFVHLQAIQGSQPYTGIQSLVGQARGVILGLIFGIIISGATWLSLKKEKTKKILGISILSITFISIAFLGVKLLQPGSKLHNQFISAATETRFIFWDAAMDGFRERPVLGWGPNTFAYPYHKYFDADMLLDRNGKEVWVDHAHNIIFETLVTGGILLLAALIFFIYSVIRRLIKSHNRGSLTSLEASLLIGAIAAWFLQNLFVFDSLSSLVMLFLVASIAYGLSSAADQKARPINSRKLILGSILIFCILSFIYAIYLPAKKAFAMKNTFESKLLSRPMQWQKLHGISKMGDGMDSTLLFHGIQASYASQLKNVLNGDQKLKDAAIADIDATVSYMAKITNENNFDLKLIAARLEYLRMVIADDFSGEHFENGKKLSNDAALISPTDPQPLTIAAQIVIGAGDFKMGKDILERALILQPELENTHKMILQLARIMKDEKYYQSSLARAKQYIPDFSL